MLHRASITEMVVPYGDPGPMHGWKNAFDAGEWGLGRMANSLKLGCDCLGEIHYFDAVLATEQGDPYTVEHAICMHEEDYGILWKHHDMQGGTDEVRRSRRLVVSFIATVGNYEYGFYWYLYLDGNIQLEVKLTGIVSPMAIGARRDARVRERDRARTRRAAPPAPVLGPPRPRRRRHRRTRVYEVEAEIVPAGARQPVGERVPSAVPRRSTPELGAQRDMNAATSRTWRVVNEGVPQPPRPTGGIQADPDDVDADDAGRARVERRPARRVRAAQPVGHALRTPTSAAPRASIPNQHAGGDGLPRWTAADRSITDTDVVLWYTFGVTHFVRPEDWPVMPVEYTGFLLSPFGFFDRNPALDLPPSSNGACHS